MALIPHTFFPRSLFGTDSRTLDFFDPFDDLDRQMNSQLNNMFSMLQQPSQFMPTQQKYRVTLDCAGYAPSSLKTEIEGDKLVVTGQDGDTAARTGEDHSHRSFRRTFNLPKLVDAAHMTSFVDKLGTLVVDIPYKMDETGTLAGDMAPQMVDDGRAVTMDMRLPANIDPKHVHITAKDHDIIVKADERQKSPNGYSTVSFYGRGTMPKNADIKHMQCVYHDGNQLSVKAPLADHEITDHAIADHREPWKKYYKIQPV